MVFEIKDGKLFPLSEDSMRFLESRMASYSHFLRTVFGLWNQGWQAIPTFWGQYMSFEIKDGKLFPPSEDSMGSLKSRMASYFHFWEQYLVFEIEDASYSHFLRSVCDLISKHGWLLAAVGFWGKKMSGWGVEGSVVVLLILALLLILPLILLLVVLLSTTNGEGLGAARPHAGVTGQLG